MASLPSSSSSSFPPLHSFSSQVAISRAPPCCRASFSLHRQSFNPPSVIHTGAGTRFLSILLPSRPRPGPPLAPRAIHSSDPEFYKIPYVEGIPVGKKLKLWNLPLQCKKSELLEWFDGVKVRVESLELVTPENVDPKMKGISGFVEFETKQDACIAIIRLDGAKFRGHYIRMDFAEKRPHSKDYGSRRNRSNNSGRTRPSANTSTSSSTSTSTASSAAFSGSTTTVDTTLTHAGSSNTGGIATILSTGITSGSSSSYNSSNTVDAPVSDTSSSYVQINRSSSIPSSYNTSYKGNNLNYKSSSMLAQQGPGYGTSRSDEGAGNKMMKESINGNQVNAYNGSDSAGQNERFGDKIAQETIGNRQNQEESDGYYPNTSDGSNITLTNAGMSYVYGPMYGSLAMGPVRFRFGSVS